MAILDKILRLGEGKILRELEAISKAVNAIEDEFVAMSDDELWGATHAVRRQLNRVRAGVRAATTALEQATTG